MRKCRKDGRSSIGRFAVGTRLTRVAAVLILAGIATLAAAEDSRLKKDARQAGHALGTAAREIGHGARKIGRDIGHGARDAGKAVGAAAKEGGREFHRALKGDR